MAVLDIPNSIARFRTFGPVGPAYEVVDIGEPLPDGDRLLQIRILASGEIAEYRLSHAVTDPEAS